jgi:hypothetical protein
VTPEEGPAGLLPKLVATLKGIIVGVGPMVEGEARALSASPATRVFSHLHLRDSSFDFGALLEPVDPELQDAAVEAVKGQVEALLRKFLAVDPVPTADGKDGGDVVGDRTPQVGNGGIQG